MQIDLDPEQEPIVRFPEKIPLIQITDCDIKRHSGNLQEILEFKFGQTLRSEKFFIRKAPKIFFLQMSIWNSDVRFELEQKLKFELREQKADLVF